MRAGEGGEEERRAGHGGRVGWSRAKGCDVIRREGLFAALEFPQQLRPHLTGLHRKRHRRGGTVGETAGEQWRESGGSGQLDGSRGHWQWTGQ